MKGTIRVVSALALVLAFAACDRAEDRNTSRPDDESSRSTTATSVDPIDEEDPQTPLDVRRVEADLGEDRVEFTVHMYDPWEDELLRPYKGLGGVTRQQGAITVYVNDRDDGDEDAQDHYFHISWGDGGLQCQRYLEHGTAAEVVEVSRANDTSVTCSAPRSLLHEPVDRLRWSAVSNYSPIARDKNHEEIEEAREYDWAPDGEWYE